MELTERERSRLRDLVEAAREGAPEDPLLASLAAKLVAGGGPAFAKYVELLEPAGETEPGVLAALRRAIEGDERVRIRYTARSGETTDRVVRPFNIHFYDGREYLEAFCEMRGADRVFAVGNIETAGDPAAE